MIRAALIMLAVLALPARGEEVVASLSQDTIAITANFDGSEVFVFGAVKRAAPVPEGLPLDVVIALQGPLAPVTVRRKERVAGVWVNTQAVEVDLAPAFYAVATTRPFEQVLSQTEDLRHAVSIPRAIRSVGAPPDVQDSQAFTEALIRLRAESGVYRLEEGEVALAEQTLFSARFELPANLVEGPYRARIFLTRDRAVVDLYEAQIEVRKVGLERMVWALAHESPFLYGSLSLLLAIAAGWAASAAFRLIRL
ncbi:MAG: TIGR02186 family protein [Rhodobacteraceae bacterium]|nr:TIGR02186 family protein [Paracoccaceae bacterium]